MSSLTIVGYEPHTPECTNSLAFFPVQNSILWLIMLFVSCAVMMYIQDKPYYSYLYKDLDGDQKCTLGGISWIHDEQDGGLR